MTDQGRAASEDSPSRAGRFAIACRALDWSQQNTAHSLERLAVELQSLTVEEIRYYQKHQARHRNTAIASRVIAFVMATLGFLTPVIPSPWFEALSKATDLAIDAHIGYIFLALAGFAMVANRLFGATYGQIRYFSAWYELEQLIARFTLDWAKWRAALVGQTISLDERNAAFNLLEKFCADTYRIVGKETKGWADDVRRQEDALRLELRDRPRR